MSYPAPAKKLQDQLFDQIILTPLIGKEERVFFIDHYYKLTSQFEQFKILQSLRFNFCSDEFLATILK